MGNAVTVPSLAAIKSETQSIANTENSPQEKKLSPCCVCKETKRERDTCIVEKGEENCIHLIEAHKECMKKMGFNI